MNFLKKTFNIVALFCMAFSIPALSAGPWIEARDGYETAYNRHELAFRGGYDFNNGAGVMLTNAYNLEAYEQLKHSWNELEGWYPFLSLSELTIFVGAIVNENTEGSGGAGYFDFRYTVSPSLSFTLRTRYNYRNYDSVNYLGKKDPDNNMETHIGMNYVINNEWNYYLEPAYYSHFNDFHASNDKNYHWEVDNVFTYTGFKHAQPYFSAAYMDRVTAKHDDNYRIRIGLRYNF